MWIPGRGTYVRAFGVGDLATGRSFRRADHVRIASIAKTFTATAVLLGLIVERVTGQPVGKVIQTRIVDRLRLRRTSYPSALAMPRPFARGYVPGPNGRLRDVTLVNPNVAGAAGAMVSTLDDLRVWAKANAAGTLLSRASQRERLKTHPIQRAPLKVGYGMGISIFKGFLGHNGAIYGYSTAMFYLPERDATIVVEANQSTNSPPQRPSRS